jgi:hypothetical protein
LIIVSLPGKRKIFISSPILEQRLSAKGYVHLHLLPLKVIGGNSIVQSSDQSIRLYVKNCHDAGVSSIMIGDLCISSTSIDRIKKIPKITLTLHYLIIHYDDLKITIPVSIYEYTYVQMLPLFITAFLFYALIYLLPSVIALTISFISLALFVYDFFNNNISASPYLSFLLLIGIVMLIMSTGIIGVHLLTATSYFISIYLQVKIVEYFSLLLAAHSNLSKMAKDKRIDLFNDK